MNYQDDFIFALDIGTRTLIGVILEKEKKNYKIVASKSLEHDTRAMLDGQIHNIEEVAALAEELIVSLEEETGRNISSAAVAAAGRALETVESSAVIEFPQQKQITAEDINSLEFAAIQQAQEKLASQNEGAEVTDYHFVGYSVREYRLENMFLTELLHQRGNKIAADIIVTFLPRVVVDSLLAVIGELGLEVAGLTLEPIAASQIVIPQDMYNFNLALVDIGAGTADIAVTKSGSMKGYGMVPVAGDEITEAIAEEFLIDYHAAEEVKCNLGRQDSFEVRNAIGSPVEIAKDEVEEVVAEATLEMSALIAEEILNINQSAPRAVICIGGGSLTPGLTDSLADYLDLPADRVGIRDCQDLKNVSGSIAELNETQALTPLGIGVISDQNKEKTVFTKVKINGEDTRIFSLQKPTLRQALLSAEVKVDSLKGETGSGLTCTVNGELKTIPGTLGKPGSIKLNGEEATLDTIVKNGDEIEFEPGQAGEDAEGQLKDVLPAEALKTVDLIVNGEEIGLSPRIEADNKPVAPGEKLIDGQEIYYQPLNTIADAISQLLEEEQLPGHGYREVVINDRREYLPNDEYMFWGQEGPLDLSAELKEGQIIEIKQTEPVITLADLINKKLTDQEIKFNLNGNQISLPSKIYKILVNGERKELNYKIEAGDEIKINSEPLTVAKALAEINYELSQESRERVEIYLNGEKAEFTSEINPGDKLQLEFISTKSGGS